MNRCGRPLVSFEAVVNLIGVTTTKDGELWFAKIERDLLARRILTSVPDRARKIRRYIKPYNEDPKPIRWTYSNPAHRITQLLQSTTSLGYVVADWQQHCWLLRGRRVRVERVPQCSFGPCGQPWTKRAPLHRRYQQSAYSQGRFVRNHHDGGGQRHDGLLR